MKLNFLNNISEQPLLYNPNTGNGFFNTYTILFDKFVLEKKYISKYNIDGVQPIGTNTIKMRKIKIRYSIGSDNDADYISRINKIVSFFEKIREPYYLVDHDNDRRTLIDIESFENKTKQGLEYRVASDNMMSLAMIDSSWEDIDYSYGTGGADSYTEIDNNDTISIMNNGGTYSFPVIEIVPTDDMRNIRLVNTTNDESLEITFTQDITTDNKVVIDAVRGTIRLVDTVSETESDALLFLTSGSNFFKIETGRIR